MALSRPSPLRLLLAFGGWLGCAAAGWAQEPPAGPETPGLATYSDLVEVSEVSLDVLATDAAGESVLGLGPADFEVLEDGRPVELTGVSWASNRYAADAASGGAEPAGAGGHPASLPASLPASRYLIFFFHDQSAFAAAGNELLRQQLQAGRDAVRWVETAMAPSDWAAVVGYDVELRLHQDFTQDREALVRALERIAAGKKPEEFLPSRREARGRGRELSILSRIADDPSLPRRRASDSDGEPEEKSAGQRRSSEPKAEPQERSAGQRRSSERNGEPEGGTPSSMGSPPSPERRGGQGGEVLHARQRNDERPQNVYEALRQVASASGYLVGRKLLLLYTVGFGKQLGRTTIPDPRYFPDLETELNDHNVAVYPIDLSPAGRPPMEEDFLSQLAASSGGAYDPNISGFLRPLTAIAAANTGYYLLTYRSARQAGEIGYQRVEVRARDPKIRVLARRGYRYGL